MNTHEPTDFPPLPKPVGKVTRKHETLGHMVADGGRIISVPFFIVDDVSVLENLYTTSQMHDYVATDRANRLPGACGAVEATSPCTGIVELIQRALTALTEANSLREDGQDVMARRATMTDLTAYLAKTRETVKAKTPWQPLTPALLNKLSGSYWLAVWGKREPMLGEYEWQPQSWQPYGFTLQDGERMGASSITHVMPFTPPALPESQLSSKAA